jgi:hypothetical protein
MSPPAQVSREPEQLSGRATRSVDAPCGRIKSQSEAVPVSHRRTAAAARQRPTSAKEARDRPHIGTLMPRLINQTFAGQDVAKPIIIPICMRNQKAAELVIS